MTRQAIHDLVRRGRLRTREIGGHALVYRPDVEGFEPEKGGRPPSGDPAGGDSSKASAAGRLPSGGEE